MKKTQTDSDPSSAHSSAKRVAKNTGFLYLRMAITVFISLYVTRILLGSLGVEDFGIYNLVAGMVTMLVFMNAAMTGATQRFMSYAQGEGNIAKQKNIFNISIVLHLIIAVLVVLLMECVGYFLFDRVLDIPSERMSAAKYVFHFMVISTFFTIISVPYDAVINAHENMLFVAITGVIEAILKLAVAIYITYTEYDKLIIFGLLMAGVLVVMLVVKRVYCHKNYIEVEINVKKYFDVALFKEMSGFASWSFIGTTTNMLSFYGQGIVLNMFFGPTINAAQAIAAQVSGQLGAFSTTMLKALNPMIAKSEGGNDRNLMLNASMLGGKLSFFLLTIFYIPVIIEMPFIFSLWLTEVPDFAIVFCRLMLIQGLVEPFFMTLNSSIAAVGKIKTFEISRSILNIFPLVISYFLFANDYPVYSLYIVFIIRAVLQVSISLHFSKLYCNLPVGYFFKHVIIRCVVTFMIIYSLTTLVSLLIHNNIYSLLSVLLFGTFLFFVTVWFVGFNNSERLINKEFVKSILSKSKLLKS